MFVKTTDPVLKILSDELQYQRDKAELNQKMCAVDYDRLYTAVRGYYDQKERKRIAKLRHKAYKYF